MSLKGPANHKIQACLAGAFVLFCALALIFRGVQDTSAVSSPASSAARLFQCLPLRAEEIRAAGLLEAAAEKPVLFIDRLVIQKQSPEKPDDVRVWLRVVGLVLRQ